MLKKKESESELKNLKSLISGPRKWEGNYAERNEAGRVSDGKVSFPKNIINISLNFNAMVIPKFKVVFNGNSSSWCLSWVRFCDIL